MANITRIATWNANGLPNHKQELITFLNLQKIDILLVSETHFTDRTQFTIPNYYTYNSNHPDGTAHGGSAIIIKKTISHHELECYQNEKIQATTIQVHTRDWKFNLSAIYSPPRHTVTSEEYKQFLQTLGNNFIAAGDWNAKHTHWGSRLITTKGRNLLKVINDNNYFHLTNGKPTYWPTDPTKLPDLLDFFIANGIPKKNCFVESIYELSSDHTPVVINLSTTVINKVPNPTLISKQTNWELFNEYIEANINPNMRIKNPEELDDAVEHFTSIIQKAAWYSTPTKTSQEDNSTSVPLHIKQLISKKRRARGKWQRSRHIEDLHHYRMLTRQLTATLNEAQNSNFESHIQNLSADDHSLWKATKKFKRPTPPASPIRKPDSKWARTDKEKADTFANHLADVFQPFEANPGHTEVEILESLETPFQMSPPIRRINISEVKSEIEQLNPHKAPGYDLITGHVLKKLPRIAVSFLTTIFNRMISLSYFPILWKYAEIIMIHKPGKPPQDTSSYRPISLLPATGKMFERLLLKRIEEDHELEDLLPNYQFGFRKHMSTTHQTHRIVNQIAKTIEDKKYCNGVFLDVTQAFDKVWHTGLLCKLKNKLNHNYYLLLQSYLKNRHYCVKHNTERSTHYPIKSGVPQGSVLGPLLYLIYTADLPTTENTTIAAFADDIAILSRHENPVTSSVNMQNHLNLLNKWYKKWRIKINQSKSVQVTFTTLRDICPPVTVDNVVIPGKSDVKYLGLHLDQRLTWHKHIQTKRRQLDLKARQMYWLMGKKSKLSVKNKILLYKSMLKPIWSYGLQLWGCAKPSRLKIIQRFQSKTLRAIVDAPWYVSNLTLHQDLHIPFVDEEVRKLSSNYQKRLLGHSNELIENLYRNGPSQRRLNKNWPEDLVQQH